MFDLLGISALIDPYENRRVGRLEKDGLLVSTVRVHDSGFPFETAVQHPEYNSGKFIVVELYEDREAAQAGHDRWIATMVAENLPGQLQDVSTAGSADLCDALSDADWRTFPRYKNAP